LGRALLQDPDVLIVDEGLGALDPATAEVCMECIVKHARTVVVVAHE
jgi:ABC-type bacteriocin/lantibiotic exporter with double-glycine peptidase domain